VRLTVPWCLDCGRPHWYPRSHCPLCFSPKVEHREATGEGVVYSYTVLRRAPEPYALACVTLAEGVTLLSTVVDCDLDALRIGLPVRVAFRDLDGRPMPVFVRG
jgi:uncharacterized protein